MTLDEALARASEENGLAEYYRDIVRPLIRDNSHNSHNSDGEGRWPRCCGGGCEPCAEQLIRVAKRTLELMKSE
ncbi:hypothetical protein AKJ09_10168 [Labilithrix luteola]|uniref:Uncharacterized protein n=1 Tax=Labilithrix luteola TaxID=1391654 RepID=A0A0K1QDJ2_9BACT|nr:hypothetical protein [Labilithrix luteola]AKV03505.1 hypothetical protein AKJ09_10168 [Labilithrix luteola]